MTTSPNDCIALVDTTISTISRQSDEEVTITMQMPSLVESTKKLYFCFNITGKSAWVHQGSANWAYLIVERKILSLPTIIVIIAVCVILSGLLNGLVLGLMSLDLTELQVIANVGRDKEKQYGRAILSVRRTGNFLLISLVVGATILNSTTTVLIDLFVSQWVTVAIVTLTIVLFCEIIPNSIVSRFALLIGAKTIYLTWIVMIITSPVSYPLGRLLDKLLGEDIPHLTRERLKELVKITANSSALKKTEIDMISGALEMSAKKVEDIMTLMDDVYSIPLETLLDYETIGEIITSGYSRIPIYDGEKSNIVKIMYVRDLALIDPEDKTPLRLFANLTSGQEILFVEEGTTIDAVFSIFKEGTHGHMAFVVKRGKSNDQTNEVIGLLTLEDVIEEIIQVEIVDEHDVIVDNRSRRKRQRYRMISDYLTVFANTFESKNLLISPNLRIATLSFLESELSQFSPALISPLVLQRMLRQGVIIHLPKKKHKTVNPIIFSQSQASEGFVMILEGRAQIVIGPDNLKCECGPFSYFGLGILDEVVDEKLAYDYTVEAVGEVRYIKIPRELYLAAIQATNIERGLAGRVPSPYRGLLADDEEKDTADTSTGSSGKPAKKNEPSPSSSK
ncbi:ancient conserved domain protein [Nesidiocoris tenuis]|uniref:Ancient conserved domain protein n=1 Tax=Nesidiocoris tenuis TaxID=355587 RepID=A0ABN7B7C5_9HEMI|nr:ancient conserved domain protein [Nesidiocoris tenuis]